MKHFCSFSEAIREGAKIRPQHFGHGMDEARTRTCAFVAGVEAIVGALNGDEYFRYLASADFPYLIKSEAACPVETCAYGEREPLSLCGIIYHLNDQHRWTREAIANWLETEEEKIGFVTLVESESSSESLQRAVLSV